MVSTTSNFDLRAMSSNRLLAKLPDNPLSSLSGINTASGLTLTHMTSLNIARPENILHSVTTGTAFLENKLLSSKTSLLSAPSNLKRKKPNCSSSPIGKLENKLLKKHDLQYSRNACLKPSLTSFTTKSLLLSESLLRPSQVIPNSENKPELPIGKNVPYLESNCQKPNAEVATEYVPANDISKVIQPMDVSDQKHKVDLSTYQPQDYVFHVEELAAPDFGLESQSYPGVGDTRLTVSPAATDGTTELKLSFINRMAGALVSVPNFRDTDDVTRLGLIELAAEISNVDPEFVLKICLYSRRQLNLRAPANFLLAVSASLPTCRPFLRKYFSACIMLPSDWTEVADLYTTLSAGSIPAALRRVMCLKFVDFDEYQLAKYNKEKATLRKRKAGSVARFTLKQLIRKLHIVTPEQFVMSIIGKRYPRTLDEFYAARLPGEFDDEFAGKRMKLKVPETWETQISLRGNKAEIWQQLLDNKKLPYMAMLRNLRNIIRSGVDSKHHDMVLKRLDDPMSVARSKQFPFRYGPGSGRSRSSLSRTASLFRFFSAYSAIESLGREYAKFLKDSVKVNTPESEKMLKRNVRNLKKKGLYANAKRLLKTGLSRKLKGIQYSQPLLDRYKKALDNAVIAATRYNVSPIPGTTYILCEVSHEMMVPCQIVRGLDKSRTILEVGLLLGLMCKHACEDCRFILYCGHKVVTVSLRPGTVLANMDELLATCGTMLAGVLRGQPTDPPLHMLWPMFHSRERLDTLVAITPGTVGCYNICNEFCLKFRQRVNPELLFAFVDLPGKMGSLSGIHHPNNVYIAGFSDQLLRFVSERGNRALLTRVSNIDKIFNLQSSDQKANVEARRMEVELPLQLTSQRIRWKTVKVFLSSTFRDMHSERDLLSRFVFPEIRKRFRPSMLNIFDVDLRWGITEKQFTSSKSVELCLTQVAESDLFIGLLGNRYGYIPTHYDRLPELDRFRWINEHVTPGQHSITHLEMLQGGLAVEEKRSTSHFFIRNCSHLEVPNDRLDDFDEVDPSKRALLVQLKNEVRCSGMPYHEYPAEWVPGSGVGGLQYLGETVIDVLDAAIKRDFLAESVPLDEEEHQVQQELALMASLADGFVGRSEVIGKLVTMVDQRASSLISIEGPSGSGKSSLIAVLVNKLELLGVKIAYHFVDATAVSRNISFTLRKLCRTLDRDSDIDDGLSYNKLVENFHDCLVNASRKEKVVVVIDGVDAFNDRHSPGNMEWLPRDLSAVVILTCISGGFPATKLGKRKCDVINLPLLEVSDRSQLVRNRLSKNNKQLDESAFNNQMRMLVGKRDSGLPIYLTMACDEIRLVGRFEDLSKQLKSLPQNLSHLMQTSLVRLEADVGLKELRLVMSLICICQEGLSMDEIQQLLNIYYSFDSINSVSPDSIFELKVGKKVPDFTIVRMFTSLQCLFRTNSEVLVLGSDLVVDAIRRRYLPLPQSDASVACYKLLACFSLLRTDPAGKREWTGTCEKSFRHLIHYLHHGCAETLARRCLSDLKFCYKMVFFGMSQRLLSDFALVADKAGDDRLNVVRVFIEKNGLYLGRFKSMFWQLALCEPSSSHVYKTATTVKAPMFHWCNKREGPSPCTGTLHLETVEVSCTAISPNSDEIVVGGSDGSLLLYNLKTGALIRGFLGHPSSVVSANFVGDTRLCSTSEEGSCHLWQTDDSTRVASLSGHSRRVNKVVSDSRAQVIVTAGWDCFLKSWDPATGKFKGDVHVGKSPVNCITFHPDDSEKVAIGSWDSCIKIFHVSNKKQLAVLKGHSRSVRDIAYSPSGQHIISAGLGGELFVWSAEKGVVVGSLKGHVGPVSSVTFLGTSDKVASSGEDGRMKVWSSNIGKEVVRIVGDPAFGEATCVAISPCVEYLVVGFHEGCVCVYRVSSNLTLASVNVHSARVNQVKWLSSTCIISASDDRTMKLIQCRGGLWADECTTVSHVLSSHSKGVISMAWHSHNSVLASGSDDCTVKLWNMEGAMTRWGKSEKCLNWSPTQSSAEHHAQVTGVDFNNEMDKMVTCSRDALLLIWFVNKSPLGIHVVNRVPSFHSDWINGCSFSDLGDFVVTASNDFSIKIYDCNKSKEKVKMLGHDGIVNHVVFRQGCVVSSSLDSTVRVWSQNGALVTTLKHGSKVNCCDLVIQMEDDHQMSAETVVTDWADEAARDTNSSDLAGVDNGEKRDLDKVYVASVTEDGGIYLYKPLVGVCLRSLVGHRDSVVSLNGTNSGFASSGRDGELKVWKDEYCTAVPEQAIPSHITCVSLAECLVTLGTSDGRVYCLSPDRLEKIGEFAAHKMAVTGCAWMDGHLVTASVDATIVTWSLTFTQSMVHGRFVRQLQSFVKDKEVAVTDSVSCLALHPRTGDLAFGQEDGTIVFWIGRRSVRARVGNWVTKIGFPGVGDTFIACSNAKVSRGVYTTGEVLKTFHLERSHLFRDLWLPGYVMANWLLVVARDDGYVSLFDLRIEGRSPKLAQLHAASVTGISLLDAERIVTGSADATIKVWSVNNDVSLTQLGHFFCPTSVVALETVKRGPDDWMVVVGDAGGNVQRFTWGVLATGDGSL